MGCFGCTQSNSQHISQDKSYRSEEAIKKGDVVQTGITVYNFERFEQFLNNYHGKKPDKIRVTSYTVEGDPIFIDLDYDGENIKYFHDSSNDEYGSKEIVKDVCAMIIEEKKEQRKIDYSVSSCSKNNAYLVISIDQNDFQYKQSK